jgi:hypothetical protein
MNRLLATSVIAAGAYSLTLLAGIPAASAGAPGGAVATLAPASLLPATAALADGHDIRTRFIFENATNRPSAATGTTAAADVAALSSATAALSDGDDIRARFILETTK